MKNIIPAWKLHKTRTMIQQKSKVQTNRRVYKRDKKSWKNMV
jgi:hypothetical protein